MRADRPRCQGAPLGTKTCQLVAVPDGRYSNFMYGKLFNAVAHYFILLLHTFHGTGTLTNYHILTYITVHIIKPITQ